MRPQTFFRCFHGIGSFCQKEMYLATMEYGKHMQQTILSEHRDHEAAKKLGLLQGSGNASSAAQEVQLFRFRNPGLVSFEIKGEMVDNQLDLVTWRLIF